MHYQSRWTFTPRHAAIPTYLFEQAKLRGLEVSSPVKPKRAPVKVKEPPSRADSSVSASDIFGDDDESAGGVFELLEEMPETVTTEAGVTVQVCDMALPKNWSGRTPKLLHFFDALLRL